MVSYHDKAQSYLDKIRDLEKSIKSKQLELEALRYKASGAGAIRYDKDHVQTSPQNFMELAMSDIVEISAEVEEDIASLEEIKGHAYSLVRKMTNTEYRTLIEWYYLNCISMIELADKMHISERTAYYMRDDALDVFGKLMAS